MIIKSRIFVKLNHYSHIIAAAVHRSSCGNTNHEETGIPNHFIPLLKLFDLSLIFRAFKCV